MSDFKGLVGAAAECRRAVVTSETFSWLSESCHTGQDLFQNPITRALKAATLSSTHSQKEMDYTHPSSFKEGGGFVAALHPLDVCTDGLEALARTQAYMKSV